MFLPAMPTFIDSAPGAPSYLKTGDLNHIAFGLNLCIYRPLGVAVQTTTLQSLSDGVWTNVTFDTVRWDSVGGFGSTGGTTYTCQLAGRYQVIGSVPGGMTGSTGHGDMAVRFTVNGIAVRGSTAEPGGTVGGGASPGVTGGVIFTVSPCLSRVLTLGLGDEVCLQVQGKGNTFQTGGCSGVVQPSALAASALPIFSLFWIGG